MDAIDTSSVEEFLVPHLPQEKSGIFVTATWAQSLDGRIAAGPGQRTQLSGTYSKKMTHYLRTQHDAILVGRKTVAADNPRLSSRYSAGAPSPQPVILDSTLSWDITPDNWQNWQVLSSASQGLYKAPWVLVSTEVDPVKQRILEDVGGRVLRVQNTQNWHEVCRVLESEGIKSLMIEGGAEVLNSCMQSGLVNSVIITIAPVFLGSNGVQLSPSQRRELRHVKWWQQDSVPDAVLAGTL